MCRGASLSFQSMNEKTLEAVGRKNIPLDYFSKLMKDYHASSIPTYSELILGLLEETYASFFAGIDQLLESGQHASINMYLCELLPNSAMAQPAFMEKYQIRVADTILYQFHCLPAKGDIVEYPKVVIGTSSLPFDDWKKMYHYSLAVQTFHCLGLIRYAAINLYYEYNIRYHDFYAGLLQWCKNDPHTIAGDSFARMNAIFEKFTAGIGSLAYQEAITYTPRTQQKTLVLKYDFPTYFANIMSGRYQKLDKGQFLFEAAVDKSIQNWDDFAREIVWYGRKGEKIRPCI